MEEVSADVATARELDFEVEPEHMPELLQSPDQTWADEELIFFFFNLDLGWIFFFNFN